MQTAIGEERASLVSQIPSQRIAQTEDVDRLLFACIEEVILDRPGRRPGCVSSLKNDRINSMVVTFFPLYITWLFWYDILPSSSFFNYSMCVISSVILFYCFGLIIGYLQTDSKRIVAVLISNYAYVLPLDVA